MITRNALYDFVEALIDAAVDGDALFDAVSFRNLRGSVNEAPKVVRVECIAGELNLSAEAKRKELNVEGTVQCWVQPATAEETDLDDAMDAAFDMAQAIHGAIANDPSLSGAVCDAQFREFETGYANLGAARRGVTYLDGVINRAN